MTLNGLSGHVTLNFHYYELTLRVLLAGFESTLPYLTLPSARRVPRHTRAEASIWAQCATPTDLVDTQGRRNLLEFFANLRSCPLDTVKSVQ